MYLLKKFNGENFKKMNAIIDSYSNYSNKYINLVGSASFPFPELSIIGQIPATLCRVEGHLNSRLFPQTEPIDLAEQYIERTILKLFNLNDDSYSVNSQPHSATQANHAIYKALLKDGDRVMSLDLKYGGHISHKLGLPNNVTHYSFPMIDNNIDYEKLNVLVNKVKPKLIICGGTSFPYEINFKLIKQFANSINAYLMGDLAHIAPFIISKLHKPAFPYVDIATIDTSKSLRGPRGAILIFKNEIKKALLYSIFPKIQSSPNQTAILQKACCCNCWMNEDITEYSEKLIKFSSIIINEFKKKSLKIAFNGSNSHLIIIDLTSMSESGKDIENILLNHNILVNRNQIPNDIKNPWETSGVRISTTGLVILKYTEEDVVILSNYIANIILKKKVNTDEITNLLEKYHKNTINISNE